MTRAAADADPECPQSNRRITEHTIEERREGRAIRQFLMTADTAKIRFLGDDESIDIHPGKEGMR